jgi:hypothetical protein
MTLIHYHENYSKIISMTLIRVLACCIIYCIVLYCIVLIQIQNSKHFIVQIKYIFKWKIFFCSTMVGQEMK